MIVRRQYKFGVSLCHNNFSIFLGQMTNKFSAKCQNEITTNQSFYHITDNVVAIAAHLFL